MTYKTQGYAVGIASHVSIAVVVGGGGTGAGSNGSSMFGSNVSHPPTLLGFPVASCLRGF